MLLRATATVLAAAVAACCHRPQPATPAPPPPPPPPLRLVVLIVIDQWPTWGFEARKDLYRHGLARLMRDGAVLPRVEYPFSGTFTAAGHATMATGALPSVHGMIANGWWRRSQGKERQAEADDATTVLPLPGRDSAGLEGMSGRNLRVEGVADVLRTATAGRARSVVIGGKSRAACLAAGRRPDVALWYEPRLAGMTSSAAYGEALPAWVLELDRTHPVADLFDDAWTTGEAELLAARTGIADDAPGEGAEHQLGITFPHHLGTSTDPAKALRATPFLDRVQVDTAIAAVAGEHLGSDDTADLLVVSLSSHDYAGHNWGQESWEMIAHERVLDAEIGRLLESLDRTVGAERYAVIVTSDHGATPLIERGRTAGARRITPLELHDAAEAAAAERLGAGDWIAAVSSGMVYLATAATVRSAAERDRLLAQVAARLAAVPNVARVIRLDQLPAGCAGLDDLATRACRSRVAGESGELLVVPQDGSLVTSYLTGTSHDAPSDDNRYVPVILRVPGGAAVSDQRTILSLAPTLAALLGVPAPEAAKAGSFLLSGPRSPAP